MNMKRIGWIFAALMLVASCTKENLYDDAENPKNRLSDDIQHTNGYGLYEGEWQLSGYGTIGSGSIYFTENQIQFDFPAEALVRHLLTMINFQESYNAHYGVEWDKRNELLDDTTGIKRMLSDPDLEYYGLEQSGECNLQGYTNDTDYYDFTIKNDLLIELLKENADHLGGQTFGFRTDNISYIINLYAFSGKNSNCTALFDHTSGLWSLSLPIDVIRLINIDREIGCMLFINRTNNDQTLPAAQLIFKSTKRIG